MYRQINKKDEFHKLTQRWLAQEKGAKLLNSMASNQAELRTLLGEHYDRVIGLLQPAPNPAPAPAAQLHAPAPSTSAARHPQQAVQKPAAARTADLHAPIPSTSASSQPKQTAPRPARSWMSDVAQPLAKRRKI